MKKIVILSVILFAGFYNSLSQEVEMPVIKVVTVNNTTKLPFVSWQMNNPENVDGYIVKRLIYQYPGIVPNTYNTVAIFNNNSVFSFEDTSTVYGPAKPYEYSEEYRIVAFKNDGGIIKYSLMSNAHKTIFLTPEYNYCLRKIFLNWNKYLPWNDNISRYEIWISQNFNPFSKINISAEISEYFADIELNNNYRIFVKAVKSDATESESQYVEIFSQSPEMPDFIKADSIITENSEHKIYFSVNTAGDLENYTLFKKSDENSEFDSVTQTKILQNKIQFSDKNILPEKKYQYLIKLSDQCPKYVKTSDTAQNLALSAKTPQINQRENLILWNSIPNSDYKIYRKTEASDFENIDQVSDTFFVDDVSNIFFNEFKQHSTNGKFTYRVISESPEFKAVSNKVNVFQSEAAYWPNAFNPQSNIEENKIFKPLTAFTSDYLFAVYDYNGNKIFETTNPDLGWNGKSADGKLVKKGTYIIFVRYKTSSGIQKQYKGFVNLIYQDK